MLTDLILRRDGLGCIPDDPDPRDWDFSKLMLTIRDTMPERFSLRHYVPEVFSQGSLSSCVGNASSAAIGLLETKAGIPYSPASRLFIYYNARRYASSSIRDTGASIRYAMKSLLKFGVPDERWWPYSAWKVNSQPGWDPQRYAWSRRGGSYYRINDIGSERVLKVKTALLGGYPVVFGTELGESFRVKKGSLIIDKPTSSEVIIGRHALLIIGYIQNTDGLCFEVQNSWGTKWRDHGFVWLTEDYIRWMESSDFTIVKGWAALQQGPIGD